MELERDRSLPHGRLWVAEKGCTCPECRSAVQRRAYEADAQSRGLDAPEPDRRSTTDRVRQDNPTWWRPHPNARWRVLVPAGTAATHDEVVVITPSTGKRKKIRLGTQGRRLRLRDGHFYDQFYPVQ